MSPTFIEEARRRQLVLGTVAVIAEHGYARCSLARIAAAAGVSKAAVLYHVDGKDALVRAAYEHVRDTLVTQVGAAVDAAPTPGTAVRAYVTAMLTHLGDNPGHARVLADSLDAAEAVGITDRDDRSARWRPLATLIAAAQHSGEVDPEPEARHLAIALGGALDGAVAERLSDPHFDLEVASRVCLRLLG